MWLDGVKRKDTNLYVGVQGGEVTFTAQGEGVIVLLWVCPEGTIKESLWPLKGVLSEAQGDLCHWELRRKQAQAVTP